MRPDFPLPGDTFRDAPHAPVMVALAAGRFVMGARHNDPAAEADERPPHPVTLTRAFAVSQSPVSFAEWDAAAAHGAFGSFVPGDSNWGRLDRPVINVSWRDAQAYCSHLSTITGHRYRLLSEAEWEYCCRAGGDAVYPGGAAPSAETANFDATYGFGDGRPALARDKTTPARSFPANAFGLYDMVGQVWEWVEDAYHSSYEAAPADGAARRTGDGEGHRVVRGGSWASDLRSLRASQRGSWDPDERNNVLGFRIACDLARAPVISGG